MPGRKALAYAGLVLLLLAVAYVCQTFLVARTQPVETLMGYVRGWLPICAMIVGIAGLVLAYVFGLRKAWHITVKELRSYFTSPIPYAVAMALFAINGFIFWLILKDWVRMGQGGELGMTLMTLTFLIVLVAPLITMRLFAEEKRSGTYEMLMTRPLHDLHVVIGKFVAATGVFVAILAVTLINLLIVHFGSDPKPDWGPVWSAYIGLTGWCMAFTAIGLFCSALTTSQIAAAAMTWFALIGLWLLRVLSEVNPGKLLSLVGTYMSPHGTMEDFCQGTIDSTHCVYLLTLTLFFLFASWIALYANRSK